jgi:hypothetical protein
MTGRLAGQAAIAASAPHRADYGAITNWLTQEVERLGVKMMMRTFVEPDLVKDLAPDAVIVATGSSPRRDGFRVLRPAHELPGAGKKHVYTSWDVLGFGGGLRSAVAPWYMPTPAATSASASQKGCSRRAVTSTWSPDPRRRRRQRDPGAAQRHPECRPPRPLPVVRPALFARPSPIAGRRLVVRGQTDQQHVKRRRHPHRWVVPAAGSHPPMKGG